MWQVDIDERVTRLAEFHFPELTDSNSDIRAHLLFEDGIEWVEDADPDSIDIIIVDSTDPVGPAKGLFTQSFYAACYRALNPSGILIQQSESPLYHMPLIKEMHAKMYAAGYHDVRTLNFPQPVYPSGWWSATMAGKGVELSGFRESDVRGKRFSTRYYNADIHRAAFAVPEFMRQALKQG